LSEVLVAQLIGVVCGAAVARFGVRPAAAVAVSIGVAVLLLVPIARQTALGWARTGWRFLGRGSQDFGTTSDFRAPGGAGAIGLYWDGSRVVSVVEVLAPRGGLTRINREAFDSSHRLPLPALAACLTQHDVMLESIDIISHGYRSRAGTPAAGIYEQLVGPLPATAVRTVWLASSFDAIACPDAVARRGGGAPGAQRAISIATQRIVRALEDAGCRSRMLTAQEIRESVLQVTAGSDPRTIGAGWKSATLGDNVNIGGAVDPDALSSDLLAKLWVAPSRGTTVVVRLEPGTGPDTVRIGASWRLTAPTQPVRLPSMVTVDGRQREALLATLPIGAGRHTATIPMGEFPVANIDLLHLPPAGCGQLLGSDREGHGIAARIVGAGIATVHIAGELYLAQQIVLRALAIGARILVRTDRPQAWHHLVATIGNRQRLALAREATQTNAGYNATLVDGVNAPDPQAGVTSIYLTADPAGWPAGTPDVAVHQPGAAGQQLRLRTSVAAIDLTLVTIPHETAFLGSPRGARLPA
jgi:type VII secretion protein EccE